MSPLCTLDYINHPPDDVSALIIAAIGKRNGFPIGAGGIQWIRFPDRRLPKPWPENYCTSDGVCLWSVEAPGKGYAIYATYDYMGRRMFWKLIQERKPHQKKEQP